MGSIGPEYTSTAALHEYRLRSFAPETFDDEVGIGASATGFAGQPSITAIARWEYSTIHLVSC